MCLRGLVYKRTASRYIGVTNMGEDYKITEEFLSIDEMLEDLGVTVEEYEEMIADCTVTVSADDVAELLIASHSAVDFEASPFTSAALVKAQDAIREAIYESGYWLADD